MLLAICNLGRESKGLTAHVGIFEISSWAETAAIETAKTVTRVADFIIARDLLKRLLLFVFLFFFLRGIKGGMSGKEEREEEERMFGVLSCGGIRA